MKKKNYKKISYEKLKTVLRIITLLISITALGISISAYYNSKTGIEIANRANDTSEWNNNTINNIIEKLLFENKKD